MFAVLIQFVKFGLVGMSNTLISLAIYYLFIWMGKDLYIWGQVVGFFISVLNAYYWNNRYVFKGGKFWDGKKLLKTYLSYGGSTLLSMGLSIVEVEWLGISEWIVPVINLCITIPLNFITHKFWVYRKKRPGKNTALVTGATGMLGCATVKALLDGGYDVVALARPNSPRRSRLPQSDRLTVIDCDLGDIPQANLPPCRVWFHFAWDATDPAYRNDPVAQQQNEKASLAALHKAGETGCTRFVFAGSQAEYGIHEEPITEETPCAPRSAYGKAKLAFGEAGAQAAKDCSVEFVHLRIFSVYGAGDGAGTLISSCIRAFCAGEDMDFGPADQTWNYLNVADFTALAVAVANAEKVHGVYNVAGEDTRRLKRFIEELHALCGGRGQCRYGQRPPRPEGEVQLNPVIHKVEKDFAWRPLVTFREGVARLIQQERERTAS